MTLVATDARALGCTLTPAWSPPRDYGVGRIGACGHQLCRYNPGPNCWPCGPQPRIVRERPLRPERAVTCAECGTGFTTRATRALYCSARCRLQAWKRRQCDPSTSAPGEAGPNAASAGRASEEET